MNDSDLPMVLRPRPGIRWATDADRVVVASADGRRARVLEGTDATIWSWLSSSPSEHQLIEMVAVSLRLERTEAAERVRGLLLAWREGGLLEPEGDGEVMRRG